MRISLEARAEHSFSLLPNASGIGRWSATPLPPAEIWDHESGGERAGFIGVLGTTLGGLFVAPDRHGLARLVRSLKERLAFEVSSRNTERQGGYAACGLAKPGVTTSHDSYRRRGGFVWDSAGVHAGPRARLITPEAPGCTACATGTKQKKGPAACRSHYAGITLKVPVRKDAVSWSAAATCSGMAHPLPVCASPGNAGRLPSEARADLTAQSHMP